MSSSEHTLLDHLTELRQRLIYSFVGIAIMTGIAWSFSEYVFGFVRAPILNVMLEKGFGEGLVFTAPMDKFMAHLKVSLFAGVVSSCPFWLGQLWRFIAPGLYEEERKWGKIFVFSGSILFLIGVSFVYYIVYPLTFEFLLGFGGEIDRPMITINEYLSFFFLTTLVFGLAFELPLVLSLLAILGLITQKGLREKRNYAVVLLAILSAMITPPDLISMFLLLIPMMVLYEISVLLVGYFEKRGRIGEDMGTAE